MKVGIVYDEKYAEYDLGEGHPFRGDRFVNAMKFFESQSLFKFSNVFMLRPLPATKEDILRVHDPDYVDLIFRLGAASRPYDMETPVSPQILEAVMLIVGGAIEAGRSIFEGKAERAVAIGCGYHHAGRNYGGGFCLFNDIAAMVEYLRQKHGLKRTMIIDHDVHAGNGTSDIYYEDPNVLFVSLHQDPRTIYPGTGFIQQLGRGAGTGYNVNVPLPPGTSDETYLYALREIVPPLAEEFKPELIVGNGGSDPHFADMLGSLALTVQGFLGISQTLVKTAEKVCKGRIVLMPGSGYNPEVLPYCWYALVAGVAGLEKIDVKDPYALPVEPSFVRPKVEETVGTLKKLLKDYWKCFR
ncbi:MAG TPA: histone deacetylase [Candidatus Bathyarchaeia archaeon]|nr:histone deacetylase [Candidatus Bathyarchaeia archaeon]